MIERERARPIQKAMQGLCHFSAAGGEGERDWPQHVLLLTRVLCALHTANSDVFNLLPVLIYLAPVSPWAAADPLKLHMTRL